MNPELHRKLKEYDDKITKKTGKPPFWTRMQSWSLGLFFAFVIGIFIYPDIRIIMIILSMACLAANYYSFLKKTGEAAKFFTTEELINLSEHPENLQRFDKKTIEDFVKASHSFNQSLRLIRVILHCELKAELKQTVDAEYVGVLAGQIVNFLTGEVLNDCYQKASDGNKQKIDHIRDQILPCVHYKMKKDHKTRELIVYTLRMLIVFDFAAKKDTYLKSEQHKSRMDILSTYGAEFPIEASPVLYETIVMKYCKERYKFVEQPREDLKICNPPVYAEIAREYLNRGLAYAQQGNFTEAILDFTKSIEIGPNDAEAYFDRGLAYKNQGNFTQAIPDFTKAIEINPNLAETYSNRGNAYYGQGDFSQAISDYNKAIVIDPKLANAYYNRGLAYKNQGNFSQAISDFTKAIEISPNLAQAYSDRGTVYIAMKKYDKAWADVHKAEELGHPVPVEFLDQLKKASGRDK